MDLHSSKQQDLLRRYKLIVAYDGTRFKGFQRQSNPGDNNEHSSVTTKKYKKRRRFDETTGHPMKEPITIQQCLEDAMIQFSNLSRTELEFRFAGRTDAGVHARGQVVAVTLPLAVTKAVAETRKKLEEYDDKNIDSLVYIRKSINSRLPTDISIQTVARLCDENISFDPRKDAILKQYSYTIKYRRKVLKKDGKVLPICETGPNTIRCALDGSNIWICPWSLDDTKLYDYYCRQLTGTHDYSAFVHKQCRRDKENILTIKKLLCERLVETNEVAPVVTARFTVESKGFRRSMVRNLVGFIVDLCRGIIDDSIFEKIWTGTEDVACIVHSAPACGLCLEKVTY